MAARLYYLERHKPYLETLQRALEITKSQAAKLTSAMKKEVRTHLEAMGQEQLANHNPTDAEVVDETIAMTEFLAPNKPLEKGNYTKKPFALRIYKDKSGEREV